MTISSPQKKVKLLFAKEALFDNNNFKHTFQLIKLKDWGYIASISMGEKWAKINIFVFRFMY